MHRTGAVRRGVYTDENVGTLRSCPYLLPPSPRGNYNDKEEGNNDDNDNDNNDNDNDNNDNDNDDNNDNDDDDGDDGGDDGDDSDDSGEGSELVLFTKAKRRRTNDDERRTTNDERRTTNDERRTTNDDGRPSVDMSIWVSNTLFHTYPVLKFTVRERCNSVTEMKAKRVEK